MFQTPAQKTVFIASKNSAESDNVHQTPLKKKFYVNRQMNNKSVKRNLLCLFDAAKSEVQSGL